MTMKVRKAFSPVTIELETIEDWDDFMRILHAATHSELSFGGHPTTNLSEKIFLLIKDLER